MDFEQLYNTYFMQVYSYVIILAKNRDEAEEITQKAFFKAFTAKKAFSGGSSPQRGCKKAAKPRTVLFVSFSDTEKEIGCGTKSHCYCLRAKKRPNKFAA